MVMFLKRETRISSTDSGLFQAGVLKINNYFSSMKAL